MSERGDNDSYLLAIMIFFVLLLTINAIIDSYIGWRDMHHIINLQRRIAVLEQQAK